MRLVLRPSRGGPDRGYAGAVTLPPDHTPTPYFLYDLQLLAARAQLAREAMPAQLLYAVKANPHPEVLRALRGKVDGLDIASTGELDRALAAGWAPQQLSFTGPGKGGAALERAVRLGVVVNVESLRELDAVAALGAPRPKVRLRLNPTFRPRAWRVPMTGAPSPFGIDEEELPAVLERLHRHREALDFDGLHLHPGGQCTSMGAFAAAAAATLDLVERVHREVPVHRVNFGGGWGVVGGEALDVRAAGAKLLAMLERFRAATGAPLEAIVEPGRWLVGPAGLYVARVVSVKRSRGTLFAVLDGGLNHVARAAAEPSPAWRNLTRPLAPPTRCTLVGPLCTPFDVVGAQLELAEPQVGDLLGWEGAGAYGLTYSPTRFLSHPEPLELATGA